jgi:hypothetical protein
MKAPEKLYVDTNDDFSDSVLYGFTEKCKNDDIEYIRKDVFIEKARDAYCKVCKMPNCRTNECKMIEDFKKYIEE